MRKRKVMQRYWLQMHHGAINHAQYGSLFQTDIAVPKTASSEGAAAAKFYYIFNMAAAQMITCFAGIEADNHSLKYSALMGQSLQWYLLVTSIKQSQSQ